MRHALHAQASFAVLLACTLGSTMAGAAPAAGDAASTLSSANAQAVAHFAQPMLDSAGKGRRLFLGLNCYSCHGAFAGGGIGPSIVGASRSDVAFNVLNGNAGGMPSFAEFVDDTDITNIANYLESIGSNDEPKFFDWWKKNPKK